MEKVESERLRRLEKLGQMNEELVRTDELMEEITRTRLPRNLPLMLFIIIGASLTMAIWILIFYFSIGDSTVQSTLGTHFMK